MRLEKDASTKKRPTRQFLDVTNRKRKRSYLKRQNLQMDMQIERKAAARLQIERASVLRL